ncbi:DNA translocase FtsK, partial [Ruminococcus sp. CAG:379]
SKAADPNAALELRQNADILVDTLNSFGVQVRITGINRGPTVTRYEVQPSAGVKIAKITSLADDIALNLAAGGVRIEAPIPGKPAVGIEVANAHKDMVGIREILESRQFTESKSKLSFAVGKDIDGNIILGDIAKMPHMIIAGATGSGKSVCTNGIIMSILYHAKPTEVKLVLIDPKIVEFKIYDGIPHLLIPVVTDPRKAAGALNWATQEMDRRYALCASYNVRDLKDFNALAAKREDLDPLPQIVIVIDEFADLMMTSSKEVEDAVCRIAQKARAAGMHLIIATQRPTADVITGLIKSNVPSRIALSVKSQMDSRNILDVGGAEKLLGHGDMLYFPNGLPKPVRVQGCYCSTEEIERVVGYIKEEAKAEYSHDIMEAVEQSMPAVKGERFEDDSSDRAEGDDELIDRAIDVVVELGQASTSSLQRKLKLGYARAARIMDELEEMGVIGPHEGAKPRKVLISPQQAAERRMRRQESN